MKLDRIKYLADQNRLEELINRLYKYYPKIQALVGKHGGSEEDAKDVFQDALVLFIDKLKSPDFDLTCKPETYLYSVCFNLWRVSKRNQDKNMSIEKHQVPDFGEEDLESFIEKEDRFSRLDQILKTIGDKCKQILGLYYLQKRSMKEIAEELGYTSDQVAKNQKFKCLEKAKQMAKEVEHQSNAVIR